MIVGLFVVLAGCVHTPPQPPLPDPARVELLSRFQFVDRDGRYCRWEEEQLHVGSRRVFGGEWPDATDWCTTPSEHWVTVDLLGGDGRFVSVLTESESQRPTCRTWDVELGRPVTLAEYDARHAEKRLARALRLHGRRRLPGVVDADAFLVRGGHVAFCLFDPDGTRHELSVP